MLFYSFFKTLVGKEVAVEMKNDVVLLGTLLSVDQYLNIKLTNVNVVDKDRFPQLVRKSLYFISLFSLSHFLSFSLSLFLIFSKSLSYFKFERWQ